MFLHESSHLPKILDFFQQKGTAPVFTWYARSAAQRVELSGKVCANHFAKIANYLAQECFFEPGGALWIDLRAHWKSVLWAVAGLFVGAQVRFVPRKSDVSDVSGDGLPHPTAIAQDAGGIGHRDRAQISEVSAALQLRAARDFADGDVLVTDRPDFWTQEAGAQELLAEVDLEIVALTLADFGFAWDGALASEVRDGQAEVLGMADVLLVPLQIAESNWRDLLAAPDSSDLSDLPTQTAADGSAPAQLLPERTTQILAVDHELKRAALAAADAKTFTQHTLRYWAQEFGVCALLQITQPAARAAIFAAEGFALHENK